MKSAKKIHPYARQQHAVIAVDVVVFTVIEGKLQVLILKTNKPELKEKWAFPGGIIGAAEGLEEAAHRILEDKTNLTDVFIDQLATFGDPDRDIFGRVVSTAYIALIDAEHCVIQSTDQYEDVKWLPVTKLPKLAYDHTEVFQVALTRLRSKLEYSNIAQGILPREFTLTDLQDVYETILGKKLDKRNFRKKVLATGMLKDTGKKTEGAASRPAQLYRFTKGKITEYNILA